MPMFLQYFSYIVISEREMKGGCEIRNNTKGEKMFVAMFLLHILHDRRRCFTDDVG